MLLLALHKPNHVPFRVSKQGEGDHTRDFGERHNGSSTHLFGFIQVRLQVIYFHVESDMSRSAILISCSAAANTVFLRWEGTSP